MGSLLPKYIQVEIAMDFNLGHFKFSLPGWSGCGNAAVQTQILAPHPTLSESRARIALAALHYGLTLYANGETRIELFRRVRKAAQGLAEGQSSLTLDPWTWTIQTSWFTGLKSYQVWPWILKQREDLVSPKVYLATLRPRGGDLYVHLDISWHRTHWLGPSAALIHLHALSRDLDNQDRITLGKTLLAMNEYYGTAEGAGNLGAEVAALKSAMPVLLTLPRLPQEPARSA